MIVSPGLSIAKNTPWFACEPEFGCTFAASAPNSCLDAVDRELLDDVDVFAAAVIALAGIAFGVLVGQLRALRGHHGRARVVFRGDQLDVLFLAVVFLLDGVPDLRIDVGDGALGSVKHTRSVKGVQGWPNRARNTYRTYACAAGGRPAQTWRMNRYAGKATAGRRKRRRTNTRLPRRTAKRHPALHGGRLHLDPEGFYRQSRRDERDSVCEAQPIGNWPAFYGPRAPGRGRHRASQSGVECPETPVRRASPRNFEAHSHIR